MGTTTFMFKNQTINYLENIGKLIVRNRNWTEVCVEFEVNYYKKGNEDNPSIKWDNFEEIFFSPEGTLNFDKEAVSNRKQGLSPDSILSHVNFENVLIYFAFKEIFETNRYEMKLYRTYVLFLIFSIDDDSMVSKLNFIELLFEKILYNIEIEVKEVENREKNKKIMREQEKKNLKEKGVFFDEELTQIDITLGDSEDKKDHSQSQDDNSIINLRTNSRNNEKNERNEESPSFFDDNESINQTGNEMNIIKIYPNKIEEKILKSMYFFRKEEIKNNKTYVKKISINLLRLIMYMYFETTIVNCIYGLKTALDKIAKRQLKLEDVYWNNEFKNYLKKNYNVNKIVDISYMKYEIFSVFINNEIAEFINTRDNLKNVIEKKTKKSYVVNLVIDQFQHQKEAGKAFEFDWLIINFDDIYAFLSLNPYFFNIEELYFKYLNFLKIYYNNELMFD